MITSLFFTFLTPQKAETLSDDWIAKEYRTIREKIRDMVGQQIDTDKLFDSAKNAPVKTEKDRARLLMHVGIAAEYGTDPPLPDGFKKPFPTQKQPILRRARFLHHILGSVDIRDSMPAYKEEYKQLIVLWPKDPFLPAAFHEREIVFDLLRRYKVRDPSFQAEGRKEYHRLCVKNPSNWVMFRNFAMSENMMAGPLGKLQGFKKEFTRYLILNDPANSEAACAYFGIRPVRYDHYGAIKRTKKAYPREFAELEAEIARERS